MSAFPKLKTGAVTQYPATYSARFQTDVCRFLDGSEQRFRCLARAVRRWEIRLDRLDEAERRRVEAFFDEQEGGLGVFSFEDPADGAVYARCRLASDGLRVEHEDVTGAMAVLIVEEVQHG